MQFYPKQNKERNKMNELKWIGQQKFSQNKKSLGIVKGTQCSYEALAVLKNQKLIIWLYEALVI